MRLFEAPSEFLSQIEATPLSNARTRLQLITAPTSRSRAILPTLVGYVAL